MEPSAFRINPKTLSKTTRSNFGLLVICRLEAIFVLEIEHNIVFVMGSWLR